MASRMEPNGGARRVNPWRAGAWSFVGLLLVLPAVAMQFTAEVNWTAGDFIVAALMIGVVGHGAVGMIGNEDNPYNFLFFGVILLALLGAVLARFQPRGMAWTMAAAGLAQAAIAIGGMPADLGGGAFSAALAGLWLLAAALFRNAAREPATN
jgi:hypothetical protein